jgi:hypothetical protein
MIIVWPKYFRYKSIWSEKGNKLCLLLQFLCFCTLSVILFLFETHDVSETSFWISEDRGYLYPLGRTESVPPEEGDRIQSPKRCVLNKNRTTDNVQKHNTTQHHSLKLLDLGYNYMVDFTLYFALDNFWFGTQYQHFIGISWAVSDTKHTDGYIYQLSVQE